MGQYHPCTQPVSSVHTPGRSKVGTHLASIDRTKRLGREDLMAEALRCFESDYETSGFIQGSSSGPGVDDIDPA